MTPDKIDPLLQAKELLNNTQHSYGDNYANAIKQFEKSRDLFAQLGDVAEAGVAGIWAAQFSPDVEKLEDSRRRLTALISSAEKNRFKILQPAAYYWLAIAESNQNNFSASIKHVKVALRLALACENSFEVQHAQENLASLYLIYGDLEPALSYGSQILNDRVLYYQNPSQYWREKGTLADIALKLGFISTALSFSNEVLNILYDTSPGNRLVPASSMVSDSLRNLISALAAKEDVESALKLANDSMQIALKREDTEERARTTAEIFLLLADLKSKSRDCDGALMDYDKALEQYRSIPQITNGLYEVHKGKLLCLRQLDRQNDFATELMIVLKLSEKYRTTIREDDSRQAFFANEQTVFDVAAENALRSNDSRAAFDFVEASKARSLLDFVESPKTISEVEKDFGPVALPLPLAEIQSLLPEQVQIVQYAVLPSKLAIWVVSKSRFDLIEKPITATELEEKVSAYQSLVVGKGPPAVVRQAARDLYDLLVPPSLDGSKQICIISDTLLHQLAFASLVSPNNKYLVEDFALFYAPSASVLVLATEKARTREKVKKESLLSIGNPDYDREENPNLADLRDAETEAKVIASGYPKSLDLIGGEATKEKFLSSFATVEVVHFAGHFVANPRSPGNSKLLFAGGDLRSNQLSNYKLPKAKLVVLSACETGLERYNRSEGAIGVARTLLALGAPIVVASQWKVDSAATKDLMIAFHRNRKQNGMSSAESLRRAQLEVLTNDATKEPFYWAAFSLYGAYATY